MGFETALRDSLAFGTGICFYADCCDFWVKNGIIKAKYN